MIRRTRKCKSDLRQPSGLIWAMTILTILIVNMSQAFAQDTILADFANRSRKMGLIATIKSNENNLHPIDWKVEFHNISKNKWIFDIRECYILRMAEKLNMTDMFPYVCRIDYLFSHYFKQGFYRTKTLGDGDNICNCCWEIPGFCEWPIIDSNLK